MAKALSKNQLEFLRKMRDGEPVPRTLTNQTAKSLASQGLIRYAMMVGWVITSQGIDLIAQHKEQLDDLIKEWE